MKQAIFPEYELGFQLIPEEDEFKFDFDLLDPTKLIPEELKPVQRVGKMVLNRNPDNFFAENEQVGFHPGAYCPRSGFHQRPVIAGAFVLIPIHKSVVLVGRISMKFRLTARPALTIISSVTACHRMGIDTNPANYEPNSINDNWPRETPPGLKRGGFESYQERVEGK